MAAAWQMAKTRRYFNGSCARIVHKAMSNLRLRYMNSINSFDGNCFGRFHVMNFHPDQHQAKSDEVTKASQFHEK